MMRSWVRVGLLLVVVAGFVFILWFGTLTRWHFWDEVVVPDCSPEGQAAGLCGDL